MQLFFSGAVLLGVLCSSVLEHGYCTFTADAIPGPRLAALLPTLIGGRFWHRSFGTLDVVFGSSGTALGAWFTLGRTEERTLALERA